MSMSMIIDLSWGSTGKGLLAGYLAKKNTPDTLITAFAPNAGHTSYLDDGTKLVHKMLANGINSPSIKRVMIGPGALINEAVLVKEIENASSLGLINFNNVYVHANATVVTSDHISGEADFGRIGSTQTGSGTAAIQKILRDPNNLNVASAALKDKRFQIVSDREYMNELSKGERFQIEGAQGFGLSMLRGFYPYTTSRDVTPMQIFADCAIPWDMAKTCRIIGVTRTYPIRVNNKTGFSGPCYEDQKETSFEELGQPIELTTVTKLPRRVFTYSREQMRHACIACGPDQVFINFANYCRSYEELMEIFDHINEYSNVRYIGFGPTNDDVVDIGGMTIGNALHTIRHKFEAD